jgi:hypothetical protein
MVPAGHRHFRHRGGGPHEWRIGKRRQPGRADGREASALERIIHPEHQQTDHRGTQDQRNGPGTAVHPRARTSLARGSNNARSGLGHKRPRAETVHPDCTGPMIQP